LVLKFTQKIVVHVSMTVKISPGNRLPTTLLPY